MATMERTFVMIKPDAVQRNLTGEIISRFERNGLKIVGMKLIHISKELAEKNYAEHKGKPFYKGLIAYITSSPVVAMVLEGKNAVSVARTLAGTTDPQKALPGTIRADFGLEIGRNVLHGSDSTESAQREIAIFFSKEELVSYTRIDEQWLYE
jgi:nucleoside-diphosphate kinase